MRRNNWSSFCYHLNTSYRYSPPEDHSIKPVTLFEHGEITEQLRNVLILNQYYHPRRFKRLYPA
ncbi:MAG: hypothetical protein ABI723_06325 [Bacteroidia bacterium]